jgi:hypothetical protein
MISFYTNKILYTRHTFINIYPAHFVTAVYIPKARAIIYK